MCAQHIEPILLQCWANVCDVDPTLQQDSLNVLYCAAPGDECVDDGGGGVCM